MDKIQRHPPHIRLFFIQKADTKIGLIAILITRFFGDV